MLDVTGHQDPPTSLARRFPDDFVWGTATASYQIEGAVAEDGRLPSIWDTFSHTPGKVFEGDTGDVADDHYHRVAGDVALMSSLGVTAYRFSTAWPRVAPDGRTVNTLGLDFYDRLVDALLGAGIDPLVTLYHWDLPQTLEDLGGWRNRDTAALFADYSAAVVGRIGDRVRSWVTLNEPFCSAYIGHLDGRHAPGLTDPDATLLAIHHLLLAHGLGVDAIRAAAPEGPTPLEVGIVLNLAHVRGTDDDGPDANAALPLVDRLPTIADEGLRNAIRSADGLANRIFTEPLFDGHYPADITADLGLGATPPYVHDGDLEQISRPLDFLGVNYYSPQRVRPATAAELAERHPIHGLAVSTPPRPPLTAIGWEQDPTAFTELLLRVSREHPGLPLYISENGSAWDDTVDADGAVHDPERVAYLRAHLAAVHDAITDGAEVRGYFAWSLMDNFEWAAGYSMRFGIVHVDYETQARTIKDSGRLYASVAAANALPAAG
jgi:beta-glucosidase